MQLKQGTLLQGGKYRIEKVLGQGGFGITYLAIQPSLGREVALKEFFMKEFCSRDKVSSQVSVGSVGSLSIVERYKEKFLKEARIIASMSNNHIVKIHDIFEENGTAYYIMENIDGGSLEEIVRDKVLDEPTALRYIYDISDALKYIHSQNILHLDVKPSNILIRSNGQAVLIDFGISKRYNQSGVQTSTTPVGISKGFAPIEQYNQGVSNFSAATDIYSLGATLYRLVSGYNPPEAAFLLNKDEVLIRPLDISNSTWNAICKSMNPLRKERPQNVENFLLLLSPECENYNPNKHYETENIILENEHTVLNSSANKIKEQSLAVSTNDKSKIFKIYGVDYSFIKVEADSFMMGNMEKGFRNFFKKNDHKEHFVVLTNDFFIAETQVTQELWKSIMETNPSKNLGDKHPVDSVSWNDCQLFISKLNKLTGESFRLPTEAEWEFAARGGKETCGYMYSGSDNHDDVAWYEGNSNLTTHAVKQKKPNELGIYDMSGNVWEMCNDWYGILRDNNKTNPTGSSNGEKKVVRGGSWASYKVDCSNYHREKISPDFKDPSCGFRLVL